MEVALAVSLGTLFLYVFYGAVRLQWPANYYGATDLTSYAISATPIRFVAYRIGPIFITCLFVAVSLDRVGNSGALGSVLLGVAHGLLTLGRALLSWSRSTQGLRRHRVPIAIMRFVAFAAVLLTAVLAALTSEVFAPLVPDIGELSASLWTALLAGVVGAYILEVSRNGSVDAIALAELSRQQVDPYLWDLAYRTALLEGADPVLVRAVMLVENLQRPKWFRTLERLKGRWFRAGTYGVMQIMSPAPVSDTESVTRAVTERFRGVTARTPEGWLDYGLLKRFAVTYNPNPNFYELLEGAWSAVEESDRARPAARSDVTSEDGEPVIVVEHASLEEGLLCLVGSAVAYEGTVMVDLCHENNVVRTEACQADNGAPRRGRWTLVARSVDNVDRIVVQLPEMEETPPAVRDLTTAVIDL